MQDSSGRRFLGAWRPAKPVSEMTDDDWDAFAQFVQQEIVKRVPLEPDSPEDEPDSAL
jgi:hypothetical protein